MNQEDNDDLELRACLEPHWFRVEARHWATTDEWGDADGSYCELQIIQIPVSKHTNKGAWLWGDNHIIKKKFVLRKYIHRGRAYAAPTLEQAKEDFRKRKQFRIWRLQCQINKTQREIDLLDHNNLRFL